MTITARFKLLIKGSYVIGLLLLISGFLGCAPHPAKPSPGHLNTADVPATAPEDIPPIVQHDPFVPPPQPTAPVETYSVTVTKVPVDQLLFALAKDANINVDIHPSIQGIVTLNAIEQTLPQILARIAEQVDLRYEITDNHLRVFPDKPYLKLYRVNYVNMSREAQSEVFISTQSISNIEQISEESGTSSTSSTGSGEEDNNSTTRITNTSNNLFWQRLENNINVILSLENIDEQSQETNVIVNPESGIIAIQATHKQHQEIQKFLDAVLESAQRQVLIEATIAEVRLSDKYQAGIDWQRISGDYSYTQSFLGGQLSSSQFYAIEYNNPNSRIGNISATLRLLQTFGAVKVLSSPKIMALNNQTAVLKVVDNIVYFKIEAKPETRATNLVSGDVQTSYTTVTTPRVLPVGLIMNVTPQINENEVVTLNVRPTISRIIRYVNDPNPDLARAGVTNPIPEIQVREIESILKVNSGNIAIIGGLMEDDVEEKTTGIPVLSRIPVLGDLFSYRENNYIKTELIIFLRPTVIKNASLQGDLQPYQRYLSNPEN